MDRPHGWLRGRIGLGLILAAAVVGLGAVGAQAASKYVGSPVVVQEQSNWCWVAAGKSLASYHVGSNPSQCTAYKWGKDGSTCPNNTGTLGNVYSILVTAGSPTQGRRAPASAHMPTSRAI
jgi:hypothetical protein